MFFGAIGVHACPLVRDVTADPKVICARAGKTTITFTVDWTDPSRLPWDKKHTIGWQVREPEGGWTKAEEISLTPDMVQEHGDKTATGVLELRFHNARPGVYVIRWILL